MSKGKSLVAMRGKRTAGILIAATLTMSMAACGSEEGTPESPSGVGDFPTIPETTVRFGQGTALDHSEAAIAMELGWFSELGITVEPAPYGSVVPNDQRAAVLSAGTADVIDAGDYAVVPILQQLPNVRAFTNFDTFLGNAVVAQPDTELMSYDEYVQQGLSPAEAVEKVAASLEGQRWAYLAGPYTLQFVDIVLGRGKLSQSDVELIPVTDSNVVNLMLSGQADISTTSAPARADLEKKGFKVLLPFDPLYESADPSVDSLELRALNLAGWVTTTEFAEANHDLLLRLFGLQYRISDMLVNNRDDALDIQVPYLNSIAGTSITNDDAAKLYEDIHPVLQFDDLDSLYVEETSPLYYEWQIGSKIQGYVEEGLFQPDEIQPEDVTIAPELYEEMISLKEQAGADIAATEDLLRQANETNDDVQSALAEAKEHYKNFNFLDAQRFAAYAKATASHD